MSRKKGSFELLDGKSAGATLVSLMIRCCFAVSWKLAESNFEEPAVKLDEFLHKQNQRTKDSKLRYYCYEILHIVQQVLLLCSQSIIL